VCGLTLLIICKQFSAALTSGSFFLSCKVLLCYICEFRIRHYQLFLLFNCRLWLINNDAFLCMFPELQFCNYCITNVKCRPWSKTTLIYLMSPYVGCHISNLMTFIASCVMCFTESWRGGSCRVCACYHDKIIKLQSLRTRLTQDMFDLLSGWSACPSPASRLCLMSVC